MYTHCLIASAKILLQFANHPLALARAAVAAGIFDVPTEVPSALATLDFTATMPGDYQALLVQVVEQVGARPMAMLVRSVSTSACTAAASGCVSAERLIAGLMECVSLDFRTTV